MGFFKQCIMYTTKGKYLFANETLSVKHYGLNIPEQISNYNEPSLWLSRFSILEGSSRQVSYLMSFTINQEGACFIDNNRVQMVVTKLVHPNFDKLPQTHNTTHA